MATRKQLLEAAAALARAGQLPNAAAQLGPAAQLAAGRIGFEFSKQSNLPLAFPASSGGRGDPVPRVLSGDVQLVHVAFQPGEHSNAYAAFEANGPAGLATFLLSETPPRRVQYYQAFAARHNDPAARQILLVLAEINTGFNIGLQNSFIDIAGGVIAAGQQYPLRRPIFVPEGFALGAVVPGLAAGQIITLSGVTVVTNPAETPPPSF